MIRYFKVQINSDSCYYVAETAIKAIQYAMRNWEADATAMNGPTQIELIVAKSVSQKEYYSES